MLISVLSDADFGTYNEKCLNGVQKNRERKKRSAISYNTGNICLRYVEKRKEKESICKTLENRHRADTSVWNLTDHQSIDQSQHEIMIFQALYLQNRASNVYRINIIQSMRSYCGFYAFWTSSREVTRCLYRNQHIEGCLFVLHTSY